VISFDLHFNGSVTDSGTTMLPAKCTSHRPPMPGRQIIQHHDAVARGSQLPHGVRADVAGAARDEYRAGGHKSVIVWETCVEELRLYSSRSFAYFENVSMAVVTAMIRPSAPSSTPARSTYVLKKANDGLRVRSKTEQRRPASNIWRADRSL